MTRVTLRNDDDSNRHESCFLPNDSTRVTISDSSSSWSHFYKISKHLTDKPSSLAHYEMNFFCLSDDQHGGKFSVLLCLLVVHFMKCPPNTEVELIICTERPARYNALKTIPRFMQYLHIAIMEVDVIFLESFPQMEGFMFFKTNPNIIQCKSENQIKSKLKFHSLLLGCVLM